MSQRVLHLNPISVLAAASYFFGERTRLILVNASILAGLLLMFYRGTGLLPLAISGVFLFTLANVLMATKRGK